MYIAQVLDPHYQDQSYYTRLTREEYYDKTNEKRDNSNELEQTNETNELEQNELEDNVEIFLVKQREEKRNLMKIIVDKIKCYQDSVSIDTDLDLLNQYGEYTHQFFEEMLTTDDLSNFELQFIQDCYKQFLSIWESENKNIHNVFFAMCEYAPYLNVLGHIANNYNPFRQ